MSYQGCPCFWLEPQGRVRLSLRRFSFGLHAGDTPSPQHRCCATELDQPSGYRGGCDASALTDIELPLTRTEDGDGYLTMSAVPDADRPGRDDPLWPDACAKCGCGFLDDDVWQVNQLEVYRRSDTGEIVAFRGYASKEFAGALFDAWHLHSPEHGRAVARAIARIDLPESEQTMVGPDGIALTAICPNGCAWNVDGPATGGGRWTRSGDPRQPETLTVNPSIICGDYHGFIRSGAFTAG